VAVDLFVDLSAMTSLKSAAVLLFFFSLCSRLLDASEVHPLTRNVEDASNDAAGVSLQKRASGIMNDGRWKCPWKFNFNGCKAGYFSCACADGSIASYSIGCCSRGFWKGGCGKPCGSHDCSRYSQCSHCRSWAEPGDSCTACKPGFTGLDCKTATTQPATATASTWRPKQ